MKANELRVGNWVKGDTGQEYQISLSDFSDWYNDHNSHEYGDHINPVELTEEWLLNFGFTEAMFDYTIHTGEFYRDCIGILSIAGNTMTFQLEYAMKCTQTIIKYVHQLQNLYFALTGEELKIN